MSKHTSLHQQDMDWFIPRLQELQKFLLMPIAKRAKANLDRVYRFEVTNGDSVIREAIKRGAWYLHRNEPIQSKVCA